MTWVHPTTLHSFLPHTHKPKVAVAPEGSGRTAGEHLATRITSKRRRACWGLVMPGQETVIANSKTQGKDCFQLPLSEIVMEKWEEKRGQIHTV